jgi:uncharacterized protein YndB with AHSA1/START domain
MAGVLRSEDERVAVRFERMLEATPEEVWEALTDPELLGRWLATAAVDLRVGGEIALRFGEDGSMEGGRILVLDPPRSLEYVWTFTGEPDSVVRFELTPAGPGRTLLVLDHRLLSPGTAPGYGAGWHAHLDALEATLTGSETGDWFARYEALRPEYEEQAAALP